MLPYARPLLAMSVLGWLLHGLQAELSGLTVEHWLAGIAVGASWLHHVGAGHHLAAPRLPCAVPAAFLATCADIASKPVSMEAGCAVLHAVSVMCLHVEFDST
jgi:hypothetical protein